MAFKFPVLKPKTIDCSGLPVHDFNCLINKEIIGKALMALCSPTVYCGVCWNLKCMRIKLHKCNVALFDAVTFTGDCSPIDNSGPEESVGRAELSIPMIVLSSGNGSDVVQTTESYIHIGKGRVENESVKSSVSISLESMGRDEPVDELNITGSTDDTIYQKPDQFNLSAARELEEEKEDDNGIPLTESLLHQKKKRRRRPHVSSSSSIIILRQ